MTNSFMFWNTNSQGKHWHYRHDAIVDQMIATVTWYGARWRYLLLGNTILLTPSPPRPRNESMIATVHYFVIC